MRSNDRRLQNCSDISKAVASIPYILPKAMPSVISSQLSAKQERTPTDNSDGTFKKYGFDNAISNSCVRAWDIDFIPTNCCSVNFFAQISSPQSVILRKRASLIEKAVMLCNLIIGLGQEAYVAIGKGAVS